MIKLMDILTEKTVRLSTMKDANFEPGQFVQIMGKKGVVKLDKKSVHSLAKIIRQLSGKKGMGWSFTAFEGKLKEGNPYGLTYKKGKTVTVTHKKSGKELVIIDKPNVRKEYEKIGFFAEGKLTEGISVADTRFVGKFVIHILSSGREMRSAILSKKNAVKYATKSQQDVNSLWDLAGKYKGKEIKEGKLTEMDEPFWSVTTDKMKKPMSVRGKNKKDVEKTVRSMAPPGAIKWVKVVKEGKLNEGSKVVTLPNGIKVKIEFDGLTFIGGTKPVFLDRTEMMTFFKATARYLK